MSLGDVTCNFVSPSHSISGDENSPLAYIYVSHTPWSLIFQFISESNKSCLCKSSSVHSTVYDDNTNCIWPKCDGFYCSSLNYDSETKHLFLKAIKNKQDALEVYCIMCNLWLCLYVRNPTCNSTHSVSGTPMPTLSLKLNLTLILTLTVIQILTLLNLTKPNHSNKMLKYVPTPSLMLCFQITHTLYMWDYILAISLR